MSDPLPLAALSQLLKANDEFFGYQKWHQFRVQSPNGGNAGRWARDMIKGNWQFKPDFGAVTFFIEDDNDAMLFKLAWGGK